MSALDQVRETFFQECGELLEVLQEGLLAIGDGTADDETIHSVFRAVHSIKGGAGAFGFDHLVRFAHEFENLLDAVRNEVIVADDKIVEVLLVSCDMLGDLVTGARENTEIDPAVTDPLMAEFMTLVPQAGDALGAGDDAGGFAPLALSLDMPGAGGDAEAGFAPVTLSLDLPAASPVAETVNSYDIRFRPDAALYRNGNEAALILRALSELGEVQVTCDASRLPGLTELDPQEAYLGWDIRLLSSEAEPVVREVFEFVEGVCELEIAVLEEASVAAPENAAPDSAEPDGTEPDSAGPQAADPPVAAVPPEPQPVGGGNAAPPAAPAAPGATPAPAGPTATVRVEVNRIDRLINLVGELVMNQAMLAQVATELNISAASEFATGLDELKQLSREIQDSVMAIRAQPVKALFQRMSRIVREASAATGKKVQLKISGEMTEVDKTVIEKLADPLTHMIRNAVDHRLESTEVRLAAGKPEKGIINLSAAHRSGRIIIEITDNCGGIDRDRVRQIAIDKGLVSADDQLSSEDIDALLFRPGFSTVENVSKLSGRGVGMDVVRSAIRALSGRISIRSRPGEGSTFSISLPLTLAVLDGMVVEVAGQILVIPITAIVEMIHPEAGRVHRMSHDSNVIFVRDAYVPVVDTGHVLGYRDRLDDAAARIFVLVETDNGGHYAMVVDAIQNQRQVVIKGLEKNYGKVPGIAAATVLGDGRIALIVDPSDASFSGGGGDAVTSISLETAG